MLKLRNYPSTDRSERFREWGQGHETVCHCCFSCTHCNVTVFCCCDRAGPIAPPPHLADAYRGMIVCEKAPGAADILRVPLDLAVRGNEIQFARPLFNPRGTWVLGNELGSGSVDADGKVQMASTWEVGSVIGRGNYSGTLTPRGGTLSDTQSWHGSEDESRTRSCHIALVPAAHSQRADTKQ
jgi:hypothetical protein